MFKLKIRSLNSDYGTTTEQLVTDFLRAIGFLGNDGGRNKVTKGLKLEFYFLPNA